MAAVIPYTDRAVQILNKLGIVITPEPETPILKLLDAISTLDSKRITAIARTLQQQSAFNAVVRDNILGMEIANRYADIVGGFTSIREDSEKMVAWLEDGRLDFLERIKMGWMTLTRGSIPDRFALIKKTYLEVAKDAGEQVEREHIILNAYQDYRFGLKQAQIDSEEVIKIAAARLDARKEALQAAMTAVEQYRGEDEAARVRLELVRDEALRMLQEEDKIFQIAKDLNENLIVAYNSAEAVFARIQQTSSVKERVFRQSVTFFGTNEIVFTALSASMTSLHGLHESTKTLEAMKEGMNKGLEAIADSGSKQLDAGLRAGYGVTIKADSLRSLVNAIVDYQESSYRLIAELRTESENNAREIEHIVEDGKRRFSDVIYKAGVQ